jgi:protease-4
MYGRILTALCFAPLVVALTGCVSVDMLDVLSPSLKEHEISRDGRLASSKVLVIDISGLIRSGKHNGLFARHTTPSSIRAILDRAASDKHIKAAVLRIDSPGGEVTATDIVYHDILAFKKRTGIPVYASIMSLGTSGAYYVGAAADEIYSHPTSIVGSIGVIARVPQVAKLADKIGYSEVVFKSGKNKDLGNPLLRMPEEQRIIFQNTIDSMHERFLDVVVKQRPGYESKDELREIADGRIYTPEEALRTKLVDGIAYLDEVIAKAKLSAGLEKARVVTYNQSAGHNSNIYSKLPMQLNLLNIDVRNLLGDGQPGFHYLWMPAK